MPAGSAWRCYADAAAGAMATVLLRTGAAANVSAGPAPRQSRLKLCVWACRITSDSRYDPTVPPARAQPRACHSTETQSALNARAEGCPDASQQHPAPDVSVMILDEPAVAVESLP